jgi:hypothetical protein
MGKETYSSHNVVLVQERLAALLSDVEDALDVRLLKDLAQLILVCLREVEDLDINILGSGLLQMACDCVVGSEELISKRLQIVDDLG